MGEPMPSAREELRHRIVCYQLDGDQQTKTLDATARAFIAVTATVDENNTMRGEGTSIDFRTRWVVVFDAFAPNRRS